MTTNTPALRSLEKECLSQLDIIMACFNNTEIKPKDWSPTLVVTSKKSGETASYVFPKGVGTVEALNKFRGWKFYFTELIISIKQQYQIYVFGADNKGNKLQLFAPVFETDEGGFRRGDVIINRDVKAPIM
jgi:hypothetical protein